MVRHRRIGIIIGDIIGLLHFVGCQVVVLAARFTDLFSTPRTIDQAFLLVNESVNAPFYKFLRDYWFGSQVPVFAQDFVVALLVQEMAIVVGSAVFGLLGYFAARFVLTLVD